MMASPGKMTRWERQDEFQMFESMAPHSGEGLPQSGKLRLMVRMAVPTEVSMTKRCALMLGKHYGGFGTVHPNSPTGPI
jgi:hypothetical protein